MGKRCALTREMLTAAVMGLDPVHQTKKGIIGEIWRLWNIRIGMTQLSHWLRQWDIKVAVDQRAKREAKEVVAATLVAEKLAELRSQVAGLNKAEDIVGQLLDKAEGQLKGIALTPSMEGVAALLAEAQGLMRTSTEVRSKMAETKAAMGNQKTDPDFGSHDGRNVIDYAEAAERYKTA